MTVLLILVPVTLALSLLALFAFVWGVNKGQLDDLVTPALRILQEDDQQPKKAKPVAKAEDNER